LRAALRGTLLEAEALLLRLGAGLPSSEQLRAVAAGIDLAAIDNAATLFIEANARFARELRAAGTRLQFPQAAQRFDSPIGIVSIGTRGDDVHGPDAALIVDPGGNDSYERKPATGGAVSVIVDLSGNDSYRGSDLVVHGLSAIIDFSGNDSYATSGPGLGAAIAGVSLLVDYAGDDRYSAGTFGEGAAAFGIGALIDLGGDDHYELRSAGQGFGLAGGLGLLWDREGNDTYIATGPADTFNRGGGISMAQGAAYGFRTMLGGGIGILRDDAGNDSYAAQLFSQGAGYYYGLGLLWDGAGNDRYRAVRYAQGAGVHEAVGLLRDDSGNDYYELGFGVGQGMGLDLAVGVLYDGAGDDRYSAQSIAQGTATANGFGLLIDEQGADQFHMGPDQPFWGRAEWLRGLPSIGMLLHEPAGAMFVREGLTQLPQPFFEVLGGPLGGAPIRHEAQPAPRCVKTEPSAPAGRLVLAEALRKILPGATQGPDEAAIYAGVLWQLRTRFAASVAELPRDDFEVSYSLAQALLCALTGASAEGAARMWNEFEQVLDKDPDSPFAPALAGALRARPAPAGQMKRLIHALDAHPRCSVRAASLSLLASLMEESVIPRAQLALGSPCWRLQAVALGVLHRRGVEPDPRALLPSFLYPQPLDLDL